MAETPTTPQKKTVGKKLLFILLLVLVAAGAACGSYFFFARSGNAEPPKPPPLQVVDMGAFVVNLENANSGRYLRVSMSVAYRENTKLGEEISASQIQLKDSIIDALRQKKAGDVGNAAQTEQLKRELLLEINKHLHEGQVEQVYFTEFLVQ